MSWFQLGLVFVDIDRSLAPEQRFAPRAFAGIQVQVVTGNDPAKANINTNW
jgi:hypothetical protein